MMNFKKLILTLTLVCLSCISAIAVSPAQWKFILNMYDNSIGGDSVERIAFILTKQEGLIYSGYRLYHNRDKSPASDILTTDLYWLYEKSQWQTGGVLLKNAWRPKAWMEVDNGVSSIIIGARIYRYDDKGTDIKWQPLMDIGATLVGNNEILTFKEGKNLLEGNTQPDKLSWRIRIDNPNKKIYIFWGYEEKVRNLQP